MKTRASILFFLLLAPAIANAQTVKWLVEPKYASITHYSNDIFKCIDQNGKVQLIDWEGKALLQGYIADAVTQYSDGYAIVLQGDKILGFLTEANHNFQPVNGDYYATKYSFFSEGYVTVAKCGVEGKQGYLDSKGNLALDCQYIEAMPVRQGWALVTENGKDKVKPRRYKKSDNWSASGMSSLKSGEAFVWATSFNTDGRALARIKGGKYVVIDVNFNVIERDVKGNKEDVNSIDYSYKPIGSEELSAHLNDQPGKDGIGAFEGDGGFGYKNAEGEVLVPCQFDEANDFCSGRAVVALGDKYGIVELLKGKLDANWSADRIRVYEYTNEVDPLQITLITPASLASGNIKLELDKGDGRYVDCDALSCDFTVANQVINRKSPKCELKAKVTYSDNGFPDLLLWEESHGISIDYVSIGLSNPVTTSEYADENDCQTVKASVTNTSDVPVKASITLNVAGKPKSNTVELKPNQTCSLSMLVHVTEDKNVNATISVKVDGHNCGSKSSTVSLKKI
ncbi:MAG: WG repeat-containing protein [Bacteroidales bacterium]|nr:WG repeat-containing protein [Bacteroidales bacterium]